jgi:hypothetical protein
MVWRSGPSYPVDLRLRVLAAVDGCQSASKFDGVDGPAPGITLPLAAMGPRA